MELGLLPSRSSQFNFGATRRCASTRPGARERPRRRVSGVHGPGRTLRVGTGGPVPGGGPQKVERTPGPERRDDCELGPHRNLSEEHSERKAQSEGSDDGGKPQECGAAAGSELAGERGRGRLGGGQGHGTRGLTAPTGVTCGAWEWSLRRSPLRTTGIWREGSRKGRAAATWDLRRGLRRDGRHAGRPSLKTKTEHCNDEARLWPCGAETSKKCNGRRVRSGSRR